MRITGRKVTGAHNETLSWKDHSSFQSRRVSINEKGIIIYWKILCTKKNLLKDLTLLYYRNIVVKWVWLKIIKWEGRRQMRTEKPKRGCENKRTLSTTCPDVWSQRLHVIYFWFLFGNIILLCNFPHLLITVFYHRLLFCLLTLYFNAPTIPLLV